MAGFFGFLDFTKEGPGVRKDAPKKKAPFLFGELYFRNFSRFISINAIYMALSLFLVTQGMAGAGITNVTRNIARDKHSFGISDFFSTIRKNLKQSIIVGILNTVITAVLAVAIMIYYQSYANPETSSTFNLIGLGISVAMLMVFAMMNFYIYTLMITFNFKIKSLYANSFKFVILNFWRNLLCGIILLFVLFLYLLIFLLLPYPLTVILELLAFVITYPSFRFLLIQFMTFGSIKKYIIDPYYKEHPDADIEKRRDLGLEIPEDEDDDAISWE